MRRCSSSLSSTTAINSRSPTQELPTPKEVKRSFLGVKTVKIQNRPILDCTFKEILFSVCDSQSVKKLIYFDVSLRLTQQLCQFCWLSPMASQESSCSRLRPTRCFKVGQPTNPITPRGSDWKRLRTTQRNITPGIIYATLKKYLFHCPIPLPPLLFSPHLVPLCNFNQWR